MKKPAKPYKPIQPEEYCNRSQPLFTFDNYTRYTIETILKIIANHNYDIKDCYIKIDAEVDYGYYDETSVDMNETGVYINADIKNPLYEEQIKKYKNDMKKYNTKMKKYKATLEIYDEWKKR